jgi:hypothetical protein
MEVKKELDMSPHFHGKLTKHIDQHFQSYHEYVECVCRNVAITELKTLGATVMGKPPKNYFFR